MRIPLFFTLAWRYVRSAYATTTIRTMIFMCSISIIISTLAFALITSVMTGFEKATYKKLQNTYPDITLEAPQGTFLDAPTLITYLQQTYTDGCDAFSASSFQQMLIQPLTHHTPTTIVTVRGINPHTEPLVSSLEQIFSFPPQKLPTLLKNDGIILGNELAEQLSVTTGDQCTLLYRTDPDAPLTDNKFSSITVTVAGIMHTGISDYDGSSALCNITFLENLFQQPCYTHVAVKIKNKNEISQYYHLFTELPDISVYRWQDLYPSLISAFNLEKYAMKLILFLISVITSINIIALLFMFITAKRIDIALLLSYGMSKWYIAAIFLTFSTIIATINTIFGLCLAQFCIFLSMHYFPIPLPDVYYISTLPLELSNFTMMLLFIGIVASSVIAALIPIKTLSYHNITNTLRFE